MFTLQLLHANDFEGGTRKAFNRADEFAAVWDALDQQHENTLKLSSGDTVLAGSIFSVAGEDNETLSSVLQEVNEEVLNLDPGTLSGFATDSGRPDITILNALGMDAVTVGNHEFDKGPGAFADFLTPDSDAADLASAEWLGTFFPYLSTNLDYSQDEDLSDAVVDESDSFRASDSFKPDPINDFDGAINDDKLASATTVDVNGETIGVVGATTQRFNAGLISDTGDIVVDGEPGGNDIDLLAQQIQEDVNALTAQGINKIVVQTHLQTYALEQELAGKLSGVDILMAGGSNEILANEGSGGDGQPNTRSELNGGDSADTPYPEVRTDADGNPIALVSTDGNWEYVGNLVVEFDDNGIINPDSIDATESGPFAATQETVNELHETSEDAFAEGTTGQQARDVVDAMNDAVAELDGNVAGITDVVLEGERAEVRSQETNLGNLTADANLWYARQFEDEVDVSFKNGGGIRASIRDNVNPSGEARFAPPQAVPEIGKPEGGVSQISIGSTLAFNNGLTLLTLTQEQLVDLIESGTRAGDSITGGFGQLAGVRYSYDPTRPAGERVTELSLVDGDGAADGEVVETQVIVDDGAFVGNANETIRLVTLDFLANVGSDVLTGLSDAAANKVELPNLSAPADLPDDFTFAETGSEQDAMAEFLNQFHGTQGTAFDRAETSEIGDQRIENVLYDQVAEVYMGYLGRGPSTAEAEAAVTALETGGSLPAIAASLAGNDEAPDFLASPSADSQAVADFVETAFNNAFDRDPQGTANDPTTGLGFWVNEIQARVQNGGNVDQAILDIISGAQNTDAGNDIAAIQDRGDNAQDVAASTANILKEAPGDFQVTQIGRFTDNAVFAEDAAEIVAHDAQNQQLFVTNGNADRLDVLDVSDPANPSLTQSLNPTDAFAAAGGFTHVEAKNGIVAVGAENDSATGNGRVIFYDAATLEVLNTVEVGILPDNLQFSDDGNTVVTANEAEQVDEDEDGTPEADPKSSVSIIDISNGVAAATVETLDFTQFDGQEDSLRDQGVRIFPNRSASDDLEPEYVAINADGTEARIALQENNAFATVDLENNEITGLQGLGLKNYETSGQGLDARENGVIEIENLPIKGLYQPDQIAAFEGPDGETFYASANEGDDRDFDVSEAGEANLDPTTAATVSQNGLDELEISNIDGDTDGDGDIDDLVSFGGRSFAIWDSEGELVFDSGSDFEQIMAAEIPQGFNSDDEENEKDSESEEAGPEVEGITVGMVDGTMHAFVGLEKPGGVMIYDISTPSDATFVDYLNNRDFNQPIENEDGSVNLNAGDSGPEGLEFIDAADSPTDAPVLAIGNEITGTVTMYEFG